MLDAREGEGEGEGGNSNLEKEFRCNAQVEGRVLGRRVGEEWTGSGAAALAP